MLAGPLIFVDVDTQRDFLEPDGALAIPGVGAILDNLRRLTAFARERGIPVLATACAHTLDEEDPEPFPPHCLVGTPGQSRVEATAWPGGVTLSPGSPLPPGPLPAHLTIEKARYDVFTQAAAADYVQRLAPSDATFVVYGVATDYCIAAAVDGLLLRGRQVALVVDAIRAVDVSREPDLLSGFATRGVLLTLTDVACQAG